MSHTLAPYLNEVRAELEGCLPRLATKKNHQIDDDITPSHLPFRPHVELPHKYPVVCQDIIRNDKEKCLLESSLNSIRISFSLRQGHSTADPIEKAICSKYIRFFQQRAEQYGILRRKAVPGYTISFLITSSHLQKYGSEQILDCVLSFCAQVDREFSDVKISLNAHSRLVAAEFLKSF